MAGCPKDIPQNCSALNSLTQGRQPVRAAGLPPRPSSGEPIGTVQPDADEGEDKLEKGAKREKKTVWDLAKFYTEAFVADMAKLNLLNPDVMPKATDHIEEQIALIQTLEDKGYTYTIDDGVYFDTSKFEGYANFARLDLDDWSARVHLDWSSTASQISATSRAICGPPGSCETCIKQSAA